MDVEHATGAVGGDDHEAIVRVRALIGVGQLAYGGTEYRRTVAATNQVGLFFASPSSTHSNQLSTGAIARCGQIARKNAPCATFSTRALIASRRSLLQCGRQPQRTGSACKRSLSRCSNATGWLAPRCSAQAAGRPRYWPVHWACSAPPQSHEYRGTAKVVRTWPVPRTDSLSVDDQFTAA